MKIALTILGVLNGGFMLADGIHAMLKGKYIGPDKPGPWSALFYNLHVNVFKLGPMFIAFGLVWLVFVAGFWARQDWAYPLGMLVSVLTLWYLPIGTIFSIVVFIILMVRE